MVVAVFRQFRLPVWQEGQSLLTGDVDDELAAVGHAAFLMQLSGVRMRQCLCLAA